MAAVVVGGVGAYSSNSRTALSMSLYRNLHFKGQAVEPSQVPKIRNPPEGPIDKPTGETSELFPANPLPNERPPRGHHARKRAQIPHYPTRVAPGKTSRTSKRPTDHTIGRKYRESILSVGVDTENKETTQKLAPCEIDRAQNDKRVRARALEQQPVAPATIALHRKEDNL